MPEPEKTRPVHLERRTLPEQLRYCAEKLRDKPDDRTTVIAIAGVLDMAADGLQREAELARRIARLPDASVTLEDLRIEE